MLRRDQFLIDWLRQPNGREQLRCIFRARLGRGESYKSICEHMGLPWNVTCKELGIDSSHLEESYYPPKQGAYEEI